MFGSFIPKANDFDNCSGKVLSYYAVIKIILASFGVGPHFFSSLDTQSPHRGQPVR